MSSYYGVLYPEYWDGETGRAIQRAGGAAATLLGAFLMSNRRANMIGLYRLPVEEIRLPLTRPRIMSAFAVLEEQFYAQYDQASEFVWVREMARIRVGLKNKSAKLTTDDNRVAHINRLYADLPDNPFLSSFYERYAKVLHIKRQRTSEHHPNISPLERGFAGPSKPDNRTEQVQSSTSSALRAEEIRLAVLTKLAHSVLDEQSFASIGEFTEEVKSRAARAQIAYDSSSVRKACESAEVQRSRQSA